MKIKGSVRHEQTITGAITKADLIELIMNTIEVPFGVEPRIFVTVPGGGDYSGQQLLIGEETTLEFVIRWSDAPDEQG